jgi:hypothetical protein
MPAEKQPQLIAISATINIAADTLKTSSKKKKKIIITNPLVLGLASPSQEPRATNSAQASRGPGQVKRTFREISKLNNHRIPAQHWP